MSLLHPKNKEKVKEKTILASQILARGTTSIILSIFLINFLLKIQ